ncbi:thioredoxin family protein [Lutibacter sp.]|uniref:thioredoxin family protein n=1 Tax=Lutibacter sp. TaxID=1925666 RepID=UPI001A30D726|nr:thioredoxin family protein [Lutibacter sp.]MBI9041785.1 thioredoxin family protein [Lutibacter sp.]
MKKIVLVCFLIVASNVLLKAQISTNFSESNLNWIESYNEAKLISINENKPILIFFTGSDWCGPCKMLVADFFESEKFKDIANKEFVLYKADFPRNKSLVTAVQTKDNLKLKNKFGINSYPTICILDSKGKFVNTMKGYNSSRDTKYHYLFLNAALKKLNKKPTI